jgi:hypothetical protein
VRVGERETDLGYDFENLDLRFDTHLEVERERERISYKRIDLVIYLSY